MRLSDIALMIGAQLRGDASHQVVRVASLADAESDSLSFLFQQSYLSQLSSSRAGVVILSPQYADFWHGNALIMQHPHVGYAKAAALLHPAPQVAIGIHATAVVPSSVRMGAGVRIDANVVIGQDCILGDAVVIGAGCVLADGVRIGDRCQLGANVTILHGCQLGDDVVVESGAVIGSEGFGWAKDGVAWIKVPQIGKVVVGNRVSIGANCCIDRGAIGDTVIADGVKLDNLIHVAHNVRIGEHTAMAAASAIAGSTVIGARCTIAGKVGITGHLSIADDVHVTAMTLVSHDLTQAGVYSGSLPQDNNAQWRRNAARFRQLDAMAKRLRALEKQLNSTEDDATKGVND